MKSVLLSAALLATSLYAEAQTSLAYDINKEASGNGDSNPCWLTIFRNRVVFAANDGLNGQELWGIDTGVASRLTDIAAGNLDGMPVINNYQLAVIDTMAYFAGNSTGGAELMSWDGRTSPKLELDVREGGFGSDMENVVAHNGMLYFAANDGTYGLELWNYNPKTKYKQRLTDLVSGSISSYPRYITPYKGKIYFVANSDNWGNEIFEYDPATNNVKLLSDLFTGTTGSFPLGLTVINDVLYFRGLDMVSGSNQLWSYNGINTKKLTALADGVSDPLSIPHPFGGYKGKIYFAGDNSLTGRQLFSYDPGTGVTALVLILNPSGHSDPSNFYEYAGKLYFTATDLLNGRELWSYDGVGAPAMVSDIDGGPSSSNPANMLRVNNELYFSAFNIVTGTELFKMKDSAALSVQNMRFDAKVSVHPNPAQTVANITVSLKKAQAMGVNITDAMGKTVYTAPVQTYTTGTHTMAIPMGELPTGMYLYRLHDAQGILLNSGRIQKQ